MWLLIAFIAVPLIEIALFIQVGGLIGLWPTLLIVLVTAIAGTMLVKSQGILAIENLKRSFSDLRDPTEPLAHGAMILFAGALLLTPGFFTDAFGFALLLPPFRSWMIALARKHVKVNHFEMKTTVHREDPAGYNPRHGQGDVVEGEYSEVPPEKPTQSGPSGWTKH